MTSSRRSSSRQQQKQYSTSSTLSSPSLVEVSLPSLQTLVQQETVVAATEVVEKMSDDDSSDDNAITRCPCGKEKLPNWFGNGNNENEEDDDEGLMVQCDQCEVWQHCKCVGLEEEKDIPDQYYCEQCRPENHKSVKLAHGRRYKRQYNSLGFSKGPDEEHLQANKPTKRRKRTKEAPGSRKSSRQQQSSITDDPVLFLSMPSPIFNDIDNGLTAIDSSHCDTDEATILTRSKGQVYHSPVTDSIPLSSPTLNRRKKQQSTISSTTMIDSSPCLSSSSPPPPGRSNKAITTVGIESRSQPAPSSSPIAPSPLTSGRDEPPTSYWNQDDGHPARASSPPAKIKYPTPKMTMADMNKRAKQIMEHLDKMKSTFDDGTNPADYDSVRPISTMTINNYSDQDMDSVDEEQRPRSHSTCSSISSASTLPLLLDHDDSYNSTLLLSTSPTSPLPLDKLFERRQQQESSLEIMDRVYRELLKFQRKFGSVLQVQQTSVK